MSLQPLDLFLKRKCFYILSDLSRNVLRIVSPPLFQQRDNQGVNNNDDNDNDNDNDNNTITNNNNNNNSNDSPLPQQEPDNDPLLISTPAKHEVSYALETPGSLYQPSESSSDSEETVRGTRSSRDKLNKFLASGDISPVRSQLKMPWDMASDRTQRFHIRKAKQVVDAALGEIAPQDAEKLWISLVQSKVAAQQTNDEAIDFKLADALAECYKNAEHWGSRRQILSIMADKMDFETLQNWLPGLTRYRFKIARHHRILHGRGSVVSTVSSRRMYVSPKQLDHFLDFITSAHIVQDLPFGEKTLKLSTKEEIAVPNVIRTLIPERIVQHYNAFCRESGFVPMARSTLLAILNVCLASTRNSLQGLDYFTAQGAKAFEDLEGVVEEIGEKCGKGSLWVKEKKEQLKSAKRYLKGDYKVLVFLVNCFILNVLTKKSLSHFVILIRLIQDGENRPTVKLNAFIYKEKFEIP